MKPNPIVQIVQTFVKAEHPWLGFAALLVIVLAIVGVFTVALIFAPKTAIATSATAALAKGGKTVVGWITRTSV